MRYKSIYIILTLLLVCLSSFADGRQMSKADRTAYSRLVGTAIDKRDIKIADGAAKQKVAKVKKVEAEDEFLFDPQGEEKMYCMSLYSYDQNNSKFVKATSLKSQVRYDADGKTVYFKDLTESLGVATWLQGSIDGDTIRIAYGQPLAYYRSKYLVFFVPMIYDDNTGEMEVQDEMKFIVRGDSLLSPVYEDGRFQAAVGYVYVSDKTQGALSLDLDHSMGLVRKAAVQVPDIAPTEYVYTYDNSLGQVTKSKVNVVKDGSDLYMQISTSAPKEYIHGIIEGDSITVPSEQFITDSTFIYYYSLADPVYDETGEVTDFVETANPKKLRWHEADRSVTSSPTVYGVDYMDGLYYCMDYTTNQRLDVYGGDKPAKPMAPELVKLDAENSMFVSFNLPALDVDSNYINEEHIAYRMYFDDELYTFESPTYINVKTPMTEVPYSYADGYDFFTYGKLHYVYFYNQFKKIGIQSVYTVDGVETCSDITSYSLEETPADTTVTYDNDLVISSCRLKNTMVREGEQVCAIINVKNNGKNTVNVLTLKVSSEDYECQDNIPCELKSGASVTLQNNFQTFHDVGNSIPVYVSIAAFEDITDEAPEDNADTLYYSVYDQTLCRNKVLLEEFTSEACGWCPYGAYRIHKALDEGGYGEDVIWVCHHDGYAPDWLTNPVSTELLELFGGSTFAPAWTLNRNVNYSDEHYSVFSIPGETEDIQSSIQTALEEPCFVDIETESQVSGSTANIKVRATRNNAFAGQCPEPYVNIFILEDSIKPHNQNCYDSHPLRVHNNVLRSVLTPTWGQRFEWDSENADEAEMEFTYDIPDEYVVKNLKVVAFVSEYDSDVNQRKVFNSCSTMLTGGSVGIQTVSTSVAEADSTIYNLAGQRLSTMRKGVNIVGGRKVVKR